MKNVVDVDDNYLLVQNKKLLKAKIKRFKSLFFISHTFYQKKFLSSCMHSKTRLYEKRS